MLSIINCITEPYLPQNYKIAHLYSAYVFADWKVIVPVPDYSSVRHPAGLLAYGSSSGRLPAFAVTFLSFVPNIIIRHFYYPGRSHNYSRGSCGGFSPHFPDGLSFFCTRPPFFQMLQVFSWAFKRVSLFVWFRNTFLLHCNVCISIYLSPVVSVSAKEGITRYRTQPT